MTRTLLLGTLLATALLAPASAGATLAEDNTNAVWQTMLSGMSAERREQMSAHVKIFLFPAGMNLLDAASTILREQTPPGQAQAEIAELRRSYQDRLNESGSRTPWMPRGLAETFRSGFDVRVFCFIGEENMLAADWDANGSRARRVMIHELGHAVFDTALGLSEHAELAQIAADYAAANHQRYQPGDESELFAVAGEIWFGRHQLAPYKPGWDAKTPFDKLAPMMRFLERVYGPARDVP